MPNSYKDYHGFDKTKADAITWQWVWVHFVTVPKYRLQPGCMCMCHYMIRIQLLGDFWLASTAGSTKVLLP